MVQTAPMQVRLTKETESLLEQYKEVGDRLMKGFKPSASTVVNCVLPKALLEGIATMEKQIKARK